MIVDTEKVLREADGPVSNAGYGWKGDRPWVRLKERTGEPTRSPKIISAQVYSYASSHENSGSESSSGQGMGKIGENKGKKQVIDEARTSGATAHFASLMDICHLKNAELEAKHQKYKGRVVLRGDIVKDKSGSYAVRGVT